MIRVGYRTTAIILLTLFFLPGALVSAGDKDGPSSREVRQMIDFGISLGKQGLWKEALYRWREALRYDPENPKLLNNIAVALESQGDLEGAREAYARAMELDDHARYIERNMEDFEELFTALEQYEAECRKPPEGKAPGEEPLVDGDVVAGEAPEDGKAAEDNAAAGEAARIADTSETEAGATAEEPGSEPGSPAGDQPAEDEK